MQLYGPELGDITLEHLRDFAALRKAIFIDNRGWSVPRCGDLEFDEYDGPFARYIVAYEDGACVGGLRLIPTSTLMKFGDGSRRTYMLKDFVEGRIESEMRGAELTTEIPISDDIWEMTRFTANSPEMTRDLLAAADAYLGSIGAESVITISPLPMQRALRGFGYGTEPISQKIDFEGDRGYVVLRTSVSSRSRSRIGRAPAL